MSKQDRLKIGIICGGRSGEHEVSLMSARSVLNALDRDKYEPVVIGITKTGRWLTGPNPLTALQEATPADTAPSLQPEPTTEAKGSGSDVTINNGRRALIPGTHRNGIPRLDVIFPVLHGPYGEDGTIQGLFEMAGLPYVGCGVLGSAVGMDKAIAKALFRDAGLPVTKDLVLLRDRWAAEPTLIVERIEQALGLPCFVKPANLGSSVGISKAHTPAELHRALDLAASYDRKLIIEEAINAREIECAVLGNDMPEASVLGEIVPKREFYDYEAKYGDEDTELIIPAPLPAAQAAQIQEMALKGYRALDCAGLARVDFFLCKDTGRVFINEVNTMPGFTAVSMYPKLWEASGLPYPALIERLIALALERFEDKRQNRV